MKWTHKCWTMPRTTHVDVSKAKFGGTHGYRDLKWTHKRYPSSYKLFRLSLGQIGFTIDKSSFFDRYANEKLFSSTTKVKFCIVLIQNTIWVSKLNTQERDVEHLLGMKILNIFTFWTESWSKKQFTFCKHLVFYYGLSVDVMLFECFNRIW